MKKALILSVGGQNAPLLFSIRKTLPTFVCFMVSKQTIQEAENIVEILHKEGLSFGQKMVLAENINSIHSCYEAAVLCSQQVEKQGFRANDVFVDYTGGTKTFSAALVLASIRKGYRFLYVGGTARDKNNTGMVLSGFEEMTQSIDPWVVFGVEEKSRLALFFQKRQYIACYKTIESLLKLPFCQQKTQHCFLVLLQAVQVYEKWDLFKHKDALEQLEKIMQERKNLPSDFLPTFWEQAENNLAFLQEFEQQTHSFQNYHCGMVLTDLLANADRRKEEGRYDSAVARYYRIFEALAQKEIYDCFGEHTDVFPLHKIPESKQKVYHKRYGNSSSTSLRFGMMASYELLYEAKNELGIQFRKLKHQFKKVSDKRNESILAHGFKSLDSCDANELRSLLLQLFPFSSLPVFPNILEKEL